MKIIKFLSFLMLFLLTQSLLLAQQVLTEKSNVQTRLPEQVLTEASSIQIALSINPTVLGCSCDVKSANARVKEAKALYLPNIDLNANLALFDKSGMVAMYVPQQSSVFFEQAHKNVNCSIRPLIWQYIYSGGRIKTTNELAKIDFEKTKMEESANRYKVANKIKTIFNDCLYHKALLNYYALQIKKYKQQKTQVSNVKLKKIERKSTREQLNYDKRILDLLDTIGIELNTITSIAGELRPKIKEINVEKCVLIAYQYKHELRVTQHQEIIDGLMLNLLMSMRKYPTISAAAGMDFFLKSKGEMMKKGYLSINFSLPLFDGGALFSRIKQGKINARKSTINRVKLENEVRLSICKSYLEYVFWQKQAVSAKLIERTGQYDEADIKIIYNLNKSYYELELAVGTELDSF